MPIQPPGIADQFLRTSSRRCLGPPDVYPQDPNQKEDELNPTHVKQGFAQTHASHVPEEYGCLLSLVAKSEMVGLPQTAKVLTDLKTIQERKEESLTLTDTSKKRQSINTKDHWLVTGRNKAAVDNWFKDFVHRPFSSLVRRIPIFNKKEELLVGLCEHQIPLNRAVWFIKMSAAHALAISETSKTKKKQMPDPTNEWTHNLVRFLKDQLADLSKLIHKDMVSNFDGFQGRKMNPLG